MEKKEPSYTVGGNGNCAATMENSTGVPKKLRIELVYDPAVPLLGIYQEKTLIQKNTHTPIFIVPLFTIAMEAT